jgi:hypothetical protein
VNFQERLANIRKQMLAALKRKDRAEYHRLGAEPTGKQLVTIRPGPTASCVWVGALRRKLCVIDFSAERELPSRLREALYMLTSGRPTWLRPHGIDGPEYINRRA